MKIVITHTDFRIYWPARLKALQKAAEERGHKLIVIEIAGKGSPYSFAETNFENSDWICLFPDEKMETIDPKKASKSLFHKLDELKPDIVIAGAIAFPSGATATRWAKKRKKGVVIFDDARLEDVRRSKFVNFIKKRIYRNVDAIFCPSEKWNETYYYWGFLKSQLFYGLDVIDNSFWQQKTVMKSDYSLPHKYILTIGRQIAKKNFISLIKAFEIYKQKNENDISLVLVGEGSETNSLKEYVHNNKVPNVLFLPLMTQKELKPVYRNADLFVLPSLYGETWGLVVNEAMATGLVVAGSDQAGCTSTLIEENINGYIFSPYNVRQLATIFEIYYSQSETKKKEMSEMALSKISKWDLPQFAANALNAAEYAYLNRKKSNFFDSILMEQWNGRYNPV
jgi:glycosyltransferase involved in cell wall biosynthesis